MIHKLAKHSSVMGFSRCGAHVYTEDEQAADKSVYMRNGTRRYGCSRCHVGPMTKVISQSVAAFMQVLVWETRFCMVQTTHGIKYCIN